MVHSVFCNYHPGCLCTDHFYFVLDTDAVIDKFELVKGIEEESLSFTVHRSTVLSIVILLVGVIMIVTVLPYFLQATYSYVIEKRYSTETPNPTRLILYASELLLAILMIAYKRLLVNFIELQRRK